MLNLWFLHQLLIDKDIGTTAFQAHTRKNNMAD